jgi:uncharacterized protein (TIGR00299 family) protein
VRCGYFDCFSGAAGDMILGAMIDAGCPLEALQNVVARLRLPGVSVAAGRVTRGGIAATRVQVELDPVAQPRDRHLPEILRIIATAELAPAVLERASAVFRRLAEAEAAVHGIAVDAVHFHEVGAADAIVDIVGACAAAEHLGLQRITCSAIPTGHGSVECAHGVLPVPAPATAYLLRGVPLAACDEPGELTTPTGAAILTTLAESFGPPPAMQMTAVGYGAGTREGRTRPNVLRLLVGEVEPGHAGLGGSTPLERDCVIILEAQVDDATGQVVAYACERLLSAGALDAYVVPIIMKKGRPGQLLTVLCRPDDAAALEAIVFRETTTFGVRRHECLRSTLPREQATVTTRFGAIRVKVGRRADGTLRAWPEYEDCATAARETGASLGEVQQEALQAWVRRPDAS